MTLPNGYSHRTAEGCPSCGALSGYGPDEDGFEFCMTCGGPRYCPECGEPVGDLAGFMCEVCGDRYHDTCFPRMRDDGSLVCKYCCTDEAAGGVVGGSV